MKGNKQIFSDNKDERIKGYKKLFKKRGGDYSPPRDVASNIVEAMQAQGYEVDVNEVIAYMKASYAVFDKRYYEKR